RAGGGGPASRAGRGRRRRRPAPGGSAGWPPPGGRPPAPTPAGRPGRVRDPLADGRFRRGGRPPPPTIGWRRRTARRRPQWPAAQRGGRRAVAVALRQPRRPSGPDRVLHHGPGLVADGPTGGDQPPDEVDVLADGECLVESAELLQRAPPDDERRRGHIGHGAAGPDDGLPTPEIEGR